MTRRGCLVGVGAALAVALAYTASLMLVLVGATTDERRPVDAIVILGAAQYDGRPSPVLEARLAHGRQLWREGYARLLIVTGGKQEADRFTEAESGRRWLRSRGVPAASIALESDGHTTEESMTNVADWMHARGLRTVLLVSDPFHSARLQWEARRTGLQAWVSPTTTSPISERPKVELRFLFREALKLPVAIARALLAPKAAPPVATAPGAADSATSRRPTRP